MRIAAAVLTAALIVSGASSAPAKARTQAAGVVTGCVNVKTRALTIPAGSGSCPPGTQALSWQSAGPGGTAGTPGWGKFVPGTGSDLDQVFFDGQHLWAGDVAHNSLIEVDPGSAAVMRTLTGQQYGFNDPTTMASSAGVLWVLDAGDNSVTEIATSDGGFVRLLSGSQYGFSRAAGLAASGGHLWVTNPAGNSIVEISASTGAIERKLTSAKYGFSSPAALAFAAGHLWVANQAGNSVTEINPGTGALIRTIEDVPGPSVLAISGSQLWVIGAGFGQSNIGAVTEIDASTGVVVRRLTGAKLNLRSPEEAVFAGSKLWIEADTNVAEIDPSTGTYVRTVPAFPISDDLDNPFAIASDGQRLWATTFFGLIEFPADGPADPGPGISGCVGGQNRALTIPAAGASCGPGSAAIGWLRNGPAGPPGAGGWAGVLSGASYGFGSPDSVTAAGGRIWVTNAGGNSVTEINPADNSVVRRLTGRGYGFSAPVAGAAHGNRLWIANLDGNSVTEINTDTGSVVQVISAAKYGFSQPAALTYDNNAIWVANAAGNSVTEISTSNGSLVRVIPAAAGHFSQPVAVTGDGTNLWVANSASSSVTELSESNGRLVRLLSKGFSYPDGITATDGHIWIANRTGQTCLVTELNASDGSLIRNQEACSNDPSDAPVGISSDGSYVWVTEAGFQPQVAQLDATSGSQIRWLSGDGDGFDFSSPFPAGVTPAAGHVWVANPGSDSVTELLQSGPVPAPDAAVHACVSNSTRAVTVPAAGASCPASATAITWNVPGPAGPGTGSDLEPILSGARYQFNEPDSLAADGTDLFVANAGGNSVTELDGSDGSLIRNVAGPGYAFSQPDGLVAEGGHLWVANTGGNSVTEINVSDGSLVRVVQGAQYSFSVPSALAFDGSHIWIANAGTFNGGSSVTEINASDGSFVRTLSDNSYGFNHPDAMAFDGSNLWVANRFSDTLTEVSAADGSLVRVVPAGAGLPGAVVFDGSHIWVGGQNLSEINPSTGAQITSPVGCGLGLAFDGSHLWAACDNVEELTPDGTVIGPLGDRDDLGFDDGASSVAIAGGHVWVANSSSPDPEFAPDPDFFIATLAELPEGS